MAEVLAQVKRELGRDAIILNTRTLARGGVLGLGAQPHVEITAVSEVSDLPEPLRRGILAKRSRWTGKADGAATSMTPAVTTAGPAGANRLLSEVGALRHMVEDLVRESRRQRQPDLPQHLYDAYVKLVENDVAEEIAHELVEAVRGELTGDSLHDPRAVRAKLAEKMEAMLPVGGGIRPKCGGEPTIIALIGPTGVGKTTTTAKLAANLCLREHRRVGLITIDTYRIAAVEQLKTYAAIIDVPLEVVMTPAQLKRAVDRLSDRDVILIDTAGRSQRDSAKIRELQEFFEAVKPDEIHLVLSSTCSEAVLTQAIQQFGEVGVNRVIFTKLDEAIGFGVVLACVKKAEAELSYVTTGQDVPDDICVGERGKLVRLIMGEGLPEQLDA